MEEVSKPKCIETDIEILSISKDIPKNLKVDFMEWFARETRKYDVGKHKVFYVYTMDFNDDIEVEFIVKEIVTTYG